MNGIEYKRTLLRPMRSTSPSAATVPRKFVTATTMEVSVGLWKPITVKIVAEKYISEFYDIVSLS
jgi:hypothetical protein